METESKAEDLLAVLLWGLETFLNPSPQNILRSFEEWDDRHRLRPHLRQPERARLLERRISDQGPSYQLTEKGRVIACGGIDPTQRWRRCWDGQWRLLLFDLPSRGHATRLRLWRWLRHERFGYLQNSVWITPGPLQETSIPLKQESMSAESFVIILGRPGPSHSHAAIVNGAWDFTAIYRLYQTHSAVLAKGEALAETEHLNPAVLRKWLTQERLSWVAAIASDPLLPEALLPEGYPGQTNWQRRQRVIGGLVQKLGTQG